jgi:cytochrome c oxidase assembly protein subunit 15
MPAPIAVAAAPPVRLVAGLALAAAFLTFVVIVASAFIRHTQAGLACADWPDCYARVPAAEAAAAPLALRIARGAHRVAAIGVLAPILALALVAWTQRPAWTRIGVLALIALALVVALAALGIATPGARVPAVTLGNLLGGYLLLGVLAATVATSSSEGEASGIAAARRGVVVAALAAVLLQALLGGLIGAEFTLVEYPPFASRAEPWTVATVDPFAPLGVRDGRFVPPAAAGGLALAHALCGVAVTALALAAAFVARRRTPRLARALAALAIATPLAGAGAAAALPSLGLTVLHNACAATLVAALAAMVAGCATDPARR